MLNRPLTRRQFSSGVLAMGLAPVLSCAPRAQDAFAGQYLKAKTAKAPLLGADQPPTDIWRFETSSGLPVIRARQGEELRFRVFNELADDIFLHFFGLRIPGDMATLLVPAKTGDVEVVFTPPDAGTFWFGPLVKAAQQREMGLTGLLIVEEREPVLAAEDVTLIFDDWLLADEGRIDPDFANLAAAAGDGRLGNWFTVNGQNKPYITLPAEKPVRLRLANVANSRSMNIVFKGADGLIIARDGQPVSPQPLGLLPLQLEPGQRADVLLLEAQDQVVIALDLFEDVVEAAFLEAKGYGRKTLPGNLRLPPNPLPANPLPLAADAATMRDIPLALEGGYKGGLQQARVGKDVLDLRAMLEQGLSWAIGGNSGLGSPPLFETRTGELLAIAFDNRTTFEQALHIHGHVWTTTAPVPPEFVGPSPETQWSDTLVVAPKSTRKAYLVAGSPGTWAIQSLLAERSDAGLIGAFTVADMP